MPIGLGWRIIRWGFRQARISSRKRRAAISGVRSAYRRRTRELEREEETQEIFMESVRRQLEAEMIPWIKKQVPVKTGKLRNSIHLEPYGEGFVVKGEFYANFQKPSVRELAEEWRKRNMARVYSVAAFEAGL